ncbi:MAG: hypothetical protein E7659_05040 [Ruminococcaceae bacterium]|nr:hypothetical protein [Oscillospiraceae bacterium]
MNLKKILKNKSGVALENTLLFMLVIFSMCALLTSLTLVGFFQTRINQITLLNEVELEQIGEEFIAIVDAGGELPEEGREYGNYIAKPVQSQSSKAMAVWHKNNTDFGAAVLYVEAVKEDETVKVLYWRYSLPSHVIPPA